MVAYHHLHRLSHRPALQTAPAADPQHHGQQLSSEFMLLNSSAPEVHVQTTCNHPVGSVQVTGRGGAEASSTTLSPALLTRLLPHTPAFISFSSSCQCAHTLCPHL